MGEASNIAPPSKSQVNKAGKLLRNWFSGRVLLLSSSETDRAFGVVADYRRKWLDPPRPYTTVYARLFEEAQRHGTEHVVGRRLKRVDRIIQKLVRHPTMKLTTMEDIAGCRVVVPDLKALRASRKQIFECWPGQVSRERDYVLEPRDTGYRAIHLVVRHHGLPVEVQLRTRRQQIWAEQVEFMEDREGTLLKDGVGAPGTLARLLRLSSSFAQADEAGHAVRARKLELAEHWDRGTT